ncbi:MULTISPECIES: sugar ABC transporter substrate-binding protein [Clostridium]|uniref:Substrate-binding domain-containing protein n=1 Tax=Clostridium paridis TaxID=2803863 RepID=A0A937FFT9_9CLOT|nr:MULTISPECIES: substrate-binding domain-containing protein [Clostridium]MBL4931502.1 substrate-binding domain-containing protein [Clostridium paridis]
MKKFKVCALLMTGIMAAALFAGCGKKDAPASSDKKLVIGVSLPTQREERWVRDKETMEAYAKEKGVDLKIQVADTDVAQQASQVENLISQGIDVLVLAPADASASAQSVEKAHAAGIKVISYDRLIANCDLDLYMSFDNEKVGELQGEYITKKAPKGNYIVMAGAPTDNNATLFKKGAMKYIQPLVDKGDIKVVTDLAVDNWEPTNALKIVENSLTANSNKVDAILAPNDGTAGAAIQALSAQGLAGKIPVTGQDSELTAAQRIVQGTQSMTIFKDTRELGKAAIDAAIKFAKGESVESNGKVNNGKMDVPSSLLAAQVVDKDNLDKVLIDSGYLKKDDVYKK